MDQAAGDAEGGRRAPGRVSNSAVASRTPVLHAAATLPACLGELSHPPAGLWSLGDITTLRAAPARTVAIVGTREASAYGERTAARLASAAVRAGLVVVSGLARGVDAAAHRAAIAARGRTVAVMGPGVDVPYPAGHRQLHALVQDNGVAISEMEPGTKAFQGCFPRRNRIIAALSAVTVVVEAGFKSGAVNTASQALELGRVVAAVPGPIDEPRAAGSNQLIRDGAQVITCVEDLLTLFGLSPNQGGVSHPQDGAGESGTDLGLSPEDRAILRALGARPLPAHEVAFVTTLSVRQCSGGLLRLELAGLVKGEAGGYRLAET